MLAVDRGWAMELTEWAPYWLRVEALRARRTATTLGRRRLRARHRTDRPADYHHELVGHSSKLIRNVEPRWQQLQENKVRNLELACARVDRLVILPDEVFSFCGLVGRTTRRKGYVDGLEARGGELVAAPGGGLCQLSNLLFWMAFRLDLEILERHRHEMDLFADDERTVPFGMGATVFYNYCDLQFRNTLGRPLLVRVSVERPLLRGSFSSDAPAPYSVDVAETRHRFVRRRDGAIWRENEVTRRVSYLDGRRPVKIETVRNAGRVMYDVPAHLVETADLPAG